MIGGIDRCTAAIEPRLLIASLTVDQALWAGGRGERNGIETIPCRSRRQAEQPDGAVEPALARVHVGEAHAAIAGIGCDRRAIRVIAAGNAGGAEMIGRLADDRA